MMKTRSVIVCVVMAAAAGCGGSGAPSLDAGISAKGDRLNADMNRRCTSMQGVVTYAPGASCPQCTGEDIQKALDRADETWAHLHEPGAMTGSFALAAAAPQGVVYPAGGNATVTLSAETEYYYDQNGSSVSGGNNQRWVMTMTTHLAGALQESDGGEIVLDNGPDNRRIVGIRTSRPFDAIDVQFERPVSRVDDGPGNATAVRNSPVPGGNVNVHEFCSDFDLSGLQVTEQ